jgi:hypothetical protein
MPRRWELFETASTGGNHYRNRIDQSVASVGWALSETDRRAHDAAGVWRRRRYHVCVLTFEIHTAEPMFAVRVQSPASDRVWDPCCFRVQLLSTVLT